MRLSEEQIQELLFRVLKGRGRASFGNLGNYQKITKWTEIAK